VADHPELLDLNADRTREQLTDADAAKLKGLGYIGGAAPGKDERSADWLHINAIDYNAELDQIVISSPHLSEIYVIDHSTTIGEAAGHKGGRSGRGGDILYRWGNPKNYRAGEAADQTLFAQHNVRWIRPGLPGAGHLMMFNNGPGRPGGDYSSVVELVTPIGQNNTYERLASGRFGPEKPAWEYSASPDKKAFFSSFISGAQRLPNGNTLVCEGATGRVFEVTQDGKMVWEFAHDLGLANPADQAQPAPPHALFRATRVAKDHPGLAGKDLKPKS
jgi:hypothetical protein